MCKGLKSYPPALASQWATKPITHQLGWLSFSLQPQPLHAMGRGWWVLVSPEARVRLDSCQNLCSFQMILEIRWCPGRQSSRHEVLTGSSACHSPAESKSMLFVNMKIHESTQAEITIVGHWQGKIHEKSRIFRYLFTWERASFPGGTSSLWHCFHQGPPATSAPCSFGSATAAAALNPQCHKANDGVTMGWPSHGCAARLVGGQYIKGVLHGCGSSHAFQAHTRPMSTSLRSGKASIDWALGWSSQLKKYDHMTMLKSMANERFAMTHTNKKKQLQKKNNGSSNHESDSPGISFCCGFKSSILILSHPVPSCPIPSHPVPSRPIPSHQSNSPQWPARKCSKLKKWR